MARTTTKQLLALAVPIFIGGFVQTSYHLVNTFWVGRLGSDAVAVITVNLPIAMLLMAVASGLTLASSILVAQRHGAKDKAGINATVAQSIVWLGACAIVIVVVGLLATDSITRLYAVPETIRKSAADYLLLSFLGAPFIMYCSLYQAVLRGVGDAKAPMLIAIGSVFLNALLDPLLIFGYVGLPGMGVQGAALATLLTQVVATLLGFKLMFNERYAIVTQLSDYLPQWQTAKQLFKLGTPSAIEQGLQAFTITATTLIVAPFGAVTLAAYGLVFRLFVMITMPCFALSMAVSILVGQSLGARDVKRCQSITIHALLISLMSMVVVSSVVFIAAKPFLGVFVPTDAELLAKSVTVLQIGILAFPFIAVQLALCGALRGAGATFTALAISVVSSWLIQIPLTYVLSRQQFYGELGLWWASVIGAALAAVISIGCYRSFNWQKRLV
ncbi:MATE family efflux transporter [Halioxenophilus aromaticivorans]|uniref:Multidrug-efflux transporter n=1 Tax=Halioxenophilus aromaticivorans TaxID=1306992 RepID=A0AAV3UA36_9ALTE